MARRYANIPYYEMPKLLCVAIYRGTSAKNAAETTKLTGEKALTFTQGLSFLILGTLFQLPMVLRELF